MKTNILIILTIAFSLNAFCQKKNVNEFKPESINWYAKDIEKDKVMGVSSDRVYSELIKDKKAKKTIIVAVIDGGTDVFHEDLEGKIWMNKNEIPNNNIDDDKNGFVDDIYGWNFIGNSKGENVGYENLEYTRIVKNGNTNSPDFEAAKKIYEKELLQKQTRKKNYAAFLKNFQMAKKMIKTETGISVNSKEDARKVQTNDPYVNNAANFLYDKYDKGLTDTLIIELIEKNKKELDYYLNVDFDARKLIGDDPTSMVNRYYGNNDVKANRSSHGTSVAGVIAANRNNGIGINGIATDVKIMSLRITPQGDERDKDVALAIFYAVDNGADIINMSFGKLFSPYKHFVDSAVRYAEKNGVLMVHSAGNSGQNTDETATYPSNTYQNGSAPTNWVSVGASEKELGKSVAGIFSNYGKNTVSIFSPGVAVISLDSNDYYQKTSGTSIASPIYTGVAALILSYYPDLKPQELIALLQESSYKVTKPKKVLIPNISTPKRKKSKFINLSQCGGIVNAYNAFLLLQNKD